MTQVEEQHEQVIKPEEARGSSQASLGAGAAFAIRRVTLMCRLSDTHLTKIQSVNDCDVDADKNQSTKCPESVEELA